MARSSSESSARRRNPRVILSRASSSSLATDIGVMASAAAARAGSMALSMVLLMRISFCGHARFEARRLVPEGPIVATCAPGA